MMASFATPEHRSLLEADSGLGLDFGEFRIQFLNSHTKRLVDGDLLLLDLQRDRKAVMRRGIGIVVPALMVSGAAYFPGGWVGR